MQQDAVEFIKAGASGLIMKDATADTFVDTIRSVAVRDILEKLALHSRLQLAAYVHQAEKEAESP